MRLSPLYFAKDRGGAHDVALPSFPLGGGDGVEGRANPGFSHLALHHGGRRLDRRNRTSGRHDEMGRLISGLLVAALA